MAAQTLVQTLTAQSELLSPNECARFLGISEGTLLVWRCTRRYPLNFIKIGGRVRYRRRDVEQFLEKRTVKCGIEPAAPVFRSSGRAAVRTARS